MAATPPTDERIHCQFPRKYFQFFSFRLDVHKAQQPWHLLSEDQMLNVKFSLFFSFLVLPCVFSSAQKILSCQKQENGRWWFYTSSLWLIPPSISFLAHLLTFSVCSRPPGWGKKKQEQKKVDVGIAVKWTRSASFCLIIGVLLMGLYTRPCVEQPPPLMDLPTLFFSPIHSYSAGTADDNEGQVNQRHS